VTYYLSRGSTKAEMLLQFLNEVLGACQNVGLHVFFFIFACSITGSNTTCLNMIFTITEFRTITLIVAPMCCNIP
jgi:hypothetical protein